MLGVAFLDGAEAQIIFWEKYLTAYEAAVGTKPTDEDKRHALL